MGRHSMPSTPRGGYAAAVGKRREARAGTQAGARKTNFDGGRHRGRAHCYGGVKERRPSRETAVRSAGWHRLGGGVGHDAPARSVLCIGPMEVEGRLALRNTRRLNRLRFVVSSFKCFVSSL